MKKKILLLTVFAAMLVCLFAISTSAATIYKDENGNTLFTYVDENGDYDFDSYEGSFPITDNDGNALTWYITATVTNDSGDTVHTVASLKTLGEAGNIDANGAYRFASLVTNKNTVSINFPDNSGIKSWAFGSFGGYESRKNGTPSVLYNNILFVYCPNTLTSFGGDRPFQETSVIVVDIEFEMPITSIEQNFAHEARNLESIRIPSSVTLIKGDSSNKGAPFYNCKSLSEVEFSENSSLVEIKNSCFNGCASLRSISLPDAVTTIGNYAFANCSSLKEIKLPNSLKTIKNHAFAWCNSLKVIRMGSSFKYFNNTGDNSFTYSAGNVKEIYIPKSFYATAPDVSNGYQVSYAFHGVSSDCKFFYCGTVEEFKIAKANFLTQKSATSNNGKFTNATIITYAEYIENIDSYSKGNYVICGYNMCDAFYNKEHKSVEEVNDHNCTTNDVCRCGNIINAKTADAHSETTKLIYTYGYAQNGVKKVYCSSEDCNACDSESVIFAIFTAEGYAVKEDGTALLGAYKINSSALKEYNAYLAENGKSALKFGIVMSNANSFTILDGKYTGDKGLITESTNDNYTTVKYVISGYKNTEALVNLELIIALYVVDENGMSFVQSESDAISGKTDNATCEGSEITLDKVSLASISQATLDSGEVEIGSSYEAVLKEIVALIPTEAVAVTKEN